MNAFEMRVLPATSWEWESNLESPPSGEMTLRILSSLEEIEALSKTMEVDPTERPDMEEGDEEKLVSISWYEIPLTSDSPPASAPNFPEQIPTDIEMIRIPWGSLQKVNEVALPLPPLWPLPQEATETKGHTTLWFRMNNVSVWTSPPSIQLGHWSYPYSMGLLIDRAFQYTARFAPTQPILDPVFNQDPIPAILNASPPPSPGMPINFGLPQVFFPIPPPSPEVYHNPLPLKDLALYSIPRPKSLYHTTGDMENNPLLCITLPQNSEDIQMTQREGIREPLTLAAWALKAIPQGSRHIIIFKHDRFPTSFWNIIPHPNSVPHPIDEQRFYTH